MTDFRRIILVALLFMIGMMLWNSWEAEHAPPPTLPVVTAPSTPLTEAVNNAETISGPAETAAPTATAASQTPVEQTTPSVPVTVANRYIQIQTQTLQATIDRVGGALVSVDLLKYPVAINQPNTPFPFLSQDPATYYVATSGLVGTGLPAPQQMVYESSQQRYTLANGQQELTVDLTWQNKQGLKITKTYIFPANDYLIQVKQQVDNQSNTDWKGQFYAELQRRPVAAGGLGPFHFNTYLGAVLSSPEKRYEKISFKQMDESNLDQSIQNGWLGMVQHYFISAWVPNPQSSYHYYTAANAENDVYTIGLISRVVPVGAHQQYSTGAQLYTGPDIADKLSKIAPGMNLTVDYGVLWFIGVFIFGLMKKLYAVTGNWGWAIVLTTLIIKLLFYKLNSISFRSMAAMRNLQPKLQQLRERCGDDRQKLAQGTMELYKREKVNPLGGCLPMLVQIPVFLALYWVLAGSVELRQAPFILWIHDLSAKDPYYVLPLLMGLTIFIQQWLSPKAPDPMQQKVMMMMPVIFTALFLSFPAGLVLYWVVNNTLSILQQWYIMNHVVPKAEAKKLRR